MRRRALDGSDMAATVQIPVPPQQVLATFLLDADYDNCVAYRRALDVEAGSRGQVFDDICAHLLETVSC